MLLAFLLQGLAGSSQKVLVEAKAGDYVWQFYIIRYWTGFLVMLALAFSGKRLPNTREFVTALSWPCAASPATSPSPAALNTVEGRGRLPRGQRRQPHAGGAGGSLFFREKIHPVGLAGIVCGITAVLVLVLS